MSSPSDVVKLLQDALDTQPTIVGQPNNNAFLALKNKRLDIVQTITYDRADSVHHVFGFIQSDTAYKADHIGDSFPILQRLGLWDNKITKDLAVVDLKIAKAIHKACAEDYGIWKAAKDVCKKLIHAAVEKVYINKLKNANARELLKHLKKNFTGLHALDIVALRTYMLLLYKNAVSMPDFILMITILLRIVADQPHALAKREAAYCRYISTSKVPSGDKHNATDNCGGGNA